MSGHAPSLHPSIHPPAPRPRPPPPAACPHSQILEGILPKEVPRGAPPPDKKLLEHHFVFACVWAFGGCMLVDKVTDYRLQFSRWWQGEHKAVVFPTEVGGWALSQLWRQLGQSSASWGHGMGAGSG